MLCCGVLVLVLVLVPAGVGEGRNLTLPHIISPPLTYKFLYDDDDDDDGRMFVSPPFSPPVSLVSEQPSSWTNRPTNQPNHSTNGPTTRPTNFQESIQGQTLKAMQGPRTDPSVLAALKREIQRGRPTSSLLLNYKRDGTMFLNYLRVYPLIGDARGTITHFLGVLQVCHVCGVLFVGSTYCCGVFGLSGVLKNVFLLFFVTFRFFVEIGVCCSDCACRLVFPVQTPLC